VRAWAKEVVWGVVRSSVFIATQCECATKTRPFISERETRGKSESDFLAQCAGIVVVRGVINVVHVCPF
jgi:hypothetical protein